MLGELALTLFLGAVYVVRLVRYIQRHSVEVVAIITETRRGSLEVDLDGLAMIAAQR